MIKYTLYRILVLLPILAGLSVLVFAYIHLLPGDPITAQLGQHYNSQLAAILRRQLGLDRSVPSQYISWLGGLFHGRFGITFASGQQLGGVLAQRAPATLELTGAGLFVGLVLGLGAGIAAGLKRDTLVDRVVSTLVLTGLSAPIFWLGTLFVLLFALRLHWLPSQGYVSLTAQPGQNLKLLILPAITLGMSFAPYLARMTRAAVIDVSDEPFMEYARAKGLTQRRIVWRYTMRNAILGIVVVIALQVGDLISGQVVVEELYNWPGLGRLLVEGTLNRDYYVVQDVLLLGAVLFVICNLLGELAQARLDPRIRLS